MNMSMSLFFRILNFVLGLLNLSVGDQLNNDLLKSLKMKNMSTSVVELNYIRIILTAIQVILTSPWWSNWTDKNDLYSKNSSESIIAGLLYISASFFKLSSLLSRFFQHRLKQVGSDFYIERCLDWGTHFFQISKQLFSSRNVELPPSNRDVSVSPSKTPRCPVGQLSGIPKIGQTPRRNMDINNDINSNTNNKMNEVGRCNEIRRMFGDVACGQLIAFEAAGKAEEFELGIADLILVEWDLRASTLIQLGLVISR